MKWHIDDDNENARIAARDMAAVSAIVEEAARREADAVNREIERACEKALQGGAHGVLVQQASAGQWVIIPHESVPYGEINYQQGTRP